MNQDELQEGNEPAPPAAPPIVAARVRRAHGPWRWLIRSQTFVRKELAEILRQPRLLALLVIGPFALLLLFGTGVSQETIRLTYGVRRPGRLGVRGDARLVERGARPVHRLAGSRQRQGSSAADARRREDRSGGRVPRRSARGGDGWKERDDRGLQSRDGSDPADRDRDRRADCGAGGERDRAVHDRRPGARPRRSRDDDHRRSRRDCRRHQRA